MIDDQVHLRSTSQRVGFCSVAGVCINKLTLSLLDISWPEIEVQAPLRSAIQSRMRFLDLYEANFDKLGLIMDILFQPTHASRVTNKPPKRMYPSL